MKVALIKPPWINDQPIALLSQPLGIAYIAAVLRRDGHEISVIDAVAQGQHRAIPFYIADRLVYRIGLDYSEIAKFVPSGTDLIGISTSFTHDKYVIPPMIKELRKQCKGAKIILGGVFPSTLPRYAAKIKPDYIAVGEGEPIMAALANGKSSNEIEGLYTSEYLMDSNKPSPVQSTVWNLDALPLPARDMLPFELYIQSQSSGRGKKKFGVSIHTSRGCPFSCTFCSVHSIFRKGFRKRCAENVWKEILEIIDRYRIFHFEFEDDNLTLDRGRIIMLFKKMAAWNEKHEQKITFITPNGIRIDTLDKELLSLMKAAGCERISLAAEHGDPDILAAMNKKLDFQHITDVVSMCKTIGIKMVVYLIVGFPGETKFHWKNSVQFMKSLKRIDGRIVFSIHAAKALPGTTMLQQCYEKGYRISPNPVEMFLGGNFSNIYTPDFSTKEVQNRVVKSNRILNNRSLFQRVLSKFK